MKRANVTGQLYLLHFDAPLGNPDKPRAVARHYLGWAVDAQTRVRHHQGACGRPDDPKILTYLRTHDIGFTHVRTWTQKTRADERRLKNNGHFDRYCPLCSGKENHHV